MKKIILKENQMKLIKEYINQLQIPFEEFGDEYGKENYDYYMDYLEHIGKYGTLPPTQYDYDQLLANFNAAVANYDFFGLDSSVDERVAELKDSNPELFDVDENTLQQMDADDLFYHLTDEGKLELINQYVDMDMLLGMIQLNDNGLVYVERVISLDFDPKSSQESRTVFYDLRDYYDTMGRHWSYLDGGAEDFRHNSDFARTANSFILKGFVSPENIDYDSTIEHNALFPDEHELNLKDGSPVQINEILWCEMGKKLPLQRPIIVKV